MAASDPAKGTLVASGAQAGTSEVKGGCDHEDTKGPWIEETKDDDPAVAPLASNEAKVQARNGESNRTNSNEDEDEDGVLKDPIEEKAAMAGLDGGKKDHASHAPAIEANQDDEVSDSKEPGVAFATSNAAASNDNNAGPIKPTPAAALTRKPLISEDEFEEQADDLERVLDDRHRLIFLLIPPSPLRTPPNKTTTPRPSSSEPPFTRALRNTEYSRAKSSDCRPTRARTMVSSMWMATKRTRLEPDELPERKDWNILDTARRVLRPCGSRSKLIKSYDTGHRKRGRPRKSDSFLGAIPQNKPLHLESSGLISSTSNLEILMWLTTSWTHLNHLS